MTENTPANSQPPRRRWRLPALREVLLAFGAVVIPLLVLEGLARVLSAPPPPNAFPGLTPSSAADPELLWRNRPGYPHEDEHGPINSLGFRGSEPSARRPPLRILSLGESTTFGDGVHWRETYSYLLEGALRARGYDLEVLNGGQRAWTTVQTSRFLELELEEIDPDIVLLYHEWNDFLPTTWRSSRLRGAGLTDRQILSLSWFLRLAQSSRLVTTLRLAWARTRAESTVRALGDRLGVDPLIVTNFPWWRVPDPAPPGEKPWMDNPRPYVRVPDADREASLERIVELTLSQGATLVLIHPAYKISRPHRCVLTRVAEEHGVVWFEAEDVLGGSGRPGDRRKASLYTDNVHPNARGHRVLADALASFLEDQVLRSRNPFRDRRVELLEALPRGTIRPCGADTIVNYKLLLPSYRARYLFLRDALALLCEERCPRMLNLGTGEGELDPLLAGFTEHLDACDVNEHDLDHARELNRDLGNVHYAVEHAEKLSHPDACFDAVVCSEVLEHVEDPHALLAEVARVLRPGGHAVFTFPSHRFPVLYDPLNFVLSRSGRRLRIGAYGYGHKWLVEEAKMNVWLEDHGFEIRRLVHLSRHLAGLLECYLPGLLQRSLKANSVNGTQQRPGRFVLRPSLREPAAVAITDAMIRLDERILPRTRSSIGLGYVVKRRDS